MKHLRRVGFTCSIGFGNGITSAHRAIWVDGRRCGIVVGLKDGRSPAAAPCARVDPFSLSSSRRAALRRERDAVRAAAVVLLLFASFGAAIVSAQGPTPQRPAPPA